MEITDGGGARIALDPIAGPMLTTLCGAAAPHGTIFEYGALHPGETVYPLMPMLAKSLTIIGYQMLDFVLDPARFDVARELHIRRARLRRPGAGDRPHVRARTDRRGAPPHGIQHPMRQNCGNGLSFAAARQNTH